MPKQNSVNLDITNNADGFTMAGGTTPRSLGVSGGDILLVGSGTATLTFPTTSTTVAGLGVAQTFTAQQRFSAGISAAGSTFIGNIYAPNIVTSVDGVTGDIDITAGTGIGLGISGKIITLTNTGVSSLNGSTGGILGVAFTNAAQTFTSLQQFSLGISASGGSTFSSGTVYITNTTVDPLYVQHGTTASLKVSTTGQARSGAIRLGNSTTSTFNTFINSSDGTLTFYNGISSTGSNMLSLSASSANFGVTLNAPNIVQSYNGRTGAVQGVSAASAGSGISISGSTGAITITNTGILSFNGRTGAVEGVSAASAGSGISISGSTGAITITNVGVTGVSGATGNIRLVAGSNITITQSGSTFTIASTSSGSSSSGVTSSGQLFDFTKNAHGYSDFYGGAGPFMAFASGTGASVVFDFVDPTTYFNPAGNMTGYAHMIVGASGSYAALGCTTRFTTYVGGGVGTIDMQNPFEVTTRITWDGANASDATNNYTVYFGIDEQSGSYPIIANNQGAAAYFEYNHALNSGNWTARFVEYYGATYSINSGVAYNGFAPVTLSIKKPQAGNTGYCYMYVNGVTQGIGFTMANALVGSNYYGHARVVVRRTAAATSTGPARRTFVDYLYISQQQTR